MRFSARLLLIFSILLVASPLLPTMTFAQEEEAAAPEGLRGEILDSIKDAESKLLELAEATPEETYDWRPGEGVRSQGEVFLHVAAANYGIPSFWGVEPPEGFSFQGYEKSITGKANIKKALTAAFEHVEKGFLSLSEEDLAKEVNLFGRETTVRGGYLGVLSHAHEHLGQSIAYARTNGIVPPWSARQQQAREDAEQ